MDMRSSSSLFGALLTVLLLSPVRARAQDAFSQSEVVDALYLPSAPTAASAPEWQTAPEKTFRTTAQHVVQLNDAAANHALDEPAVSSVTVRAVYTEKELALRLEWPDATKTIVSRTETNSYGDSAAIELPRRFGGSERLPHVGMGDEGEHVYVYMQRASDEGVLSNTYTAAGFGSLTRTQALTVRTGMEYDETAKRWRAIFVRPLVDGDSNLKTGFVPVAFALWDGAKSERGGNKHLSGWKFVRLAKLPPDTGFLGAVSWGFNQSEVGDAARGKAIFGTICISCHRNGEFRRAVPGLAPDLSHVGVTAMPAYLRDSIREPSKVVVQNLQLNRHYDTAGEKDANGAYPNSAFYSWFVVDPSGKKVSKMPVFTHFSDEDVKNLVAYLRSSDESRR
jgi:complex iron-sulfur molybdoenzyme family reductase subunit gamma